MWLAVWRGQSLQSNSGNRAGGNRKQRGSHVLTLRGVRADTLADGADSRGPSHNLGFGRRGYMRFTVPLTLILLVFGFVTSAAAADSCSSQFVFCPAADGLAGSFADCTQAPCEQVGMSTMSCSCRVKSNVASVTSGVCQPGTKDSFQSRYSLVDTMGVCTSSTRRWGFCLDVKCGPEVNGTTKCTCLTVTSSEYSSNQYVIVGGNPGTCSTSYSSATPSQVLAATAFLRCRQPDKRVVDPTIVWVASP